MRILNATLVLLICLTASYAALDPGKTPKFEENDLALVIKEFSVSTKIKYEATTPGRTHEVDFQALIEVSDDQDIICIGDQLEVVKADDEEGKSLIDFAEARKGQSRANQDDFNAINEGEAETELKRYNLIKNPFNVKEMVVRARAIFAEERETVTIPAEVKEDLDNLGHGIQARLSSMRVDTKRLLSIEIEYERPEGAGGTFLEGVYALDKDGKELAGGRWDKGLSIFSKSIRFKGKYYLPAGAQVDSYKLVLATKYEVRNVDFSLTEIFQK